MKEQKKTEYSENEYDDDENKREVVGKFIRLQDILNFFKYDIAPSNLEARTEKLAAKALIGQRTINIMLIIAIGALLLFGGIAYTIVAGQQNNNVCVDMAKQAIIQNSRVVSNPAAQNTQPGTEIR